MNIIAEMWTYAELCSHNRKDSGDGDLDEFDFISDHIAVASPGSLFIQMQNQMEYCFIAELSDKLIVCFRGTDGVKAWVNNFNILPLQYGYMHQGFYDLFQEFAPAIDTYFMGAFSLCSKDFSSCPKPVFCTGHSLGGIMAQYCARHLAKHRKLPVSCVNFGAPVGGTKAWRDELDLLPINHTRVVNGYDLITRLDLGIGRHAGKLLWLKRPKWHSLFNWRKLYDHAYSQYTKALISYSRDRGDHEAVCALKKVLNRVTI